VSAWGRVAPAVAQVPVCGLGQLGGCRTEGTYKMPAGHCTSAVAIPWARTRVTAPSRARARGSPDGAIALAVVADGDGFRLISAETPE